MKQSHTPHATLRLSLVASLLMSLAMAPAHAEDSAPAVSAMNGKVSVEGGSYDGHSGGVAHGVFTMPLAHSFGLQVDGAAGHLKESAYSGVGAHLFWRDPSQGLVGLVASHQSLKNIDMNRYGVEAEKYFDGYTVGARLGHQNRSRLDNGVYAGIKGSWYYSENLALSLNLDHSNLRNTAYVSTEWQPARFEKLPGLSLYATAGAGSKDFDIVMVGARYYFGETKTLINRHRNDDPETTMGEGGWNLYPELNPATAPVATKCVQGQPGCRG